MWEGIPSQSATFPLGVPFPGVFASSGPGLSRRRLKTLMQKRVTHLLVVMLNQLYLGRPSTVEELRRPLNRTQQRIVWRLYRFVVACGNRQGPFPLAPSRSSELIACLADLEEFLDSAIGGLGSYAEEAASGPLGKFEEKERTEVAERYPQLAFSWPGRWPFEDQWNGQVAASILSRQRVVPSLRGAQVPSAWGGYQWNASARVREWQDGTST